MIIKNIIFDLDGTLIDSSAGVLESLNESFSSNKMIPIIPIESKIIGPPLREIFEKLTGINEPNQLNALTAAFKKNYDYFVIKTYMHIHSLNMY